MKADLHIHTVLSPCGSLDMAPCNIVKRAKEENLSIIGITDHNSTKNALVIKEIAQREGIYVLTGAEITTKEEIHLLAFVDGDKNLKLLQDFLDSNIIKIDNNADIFGYQLVVDEFESIVEQIDHLLINSLNCDIYEIESFVRSIGGFVIPAHIDKKQNSILSQLGYLPLDLNCNVLEVSAKCNIHKFIEDNSYLKKYNFIRSSDAHYLEDIGCGYTQIEIEDSNLNFEVIKNSINSY